MAPILKKLNKEVGTKGQLTIFDFISTFNIPAKASKEDKASVKDVSSSDDYLTKGERLTTLAKEKFKKFIKSFSFTGLERRVYSLSIDNCRDVRTLASKVAQAIRPALKSLAEEDDAAFTAIRSLIGEEYAFSISRIPLDSHLMKSGAATYLRLRQKKSADLLLLKLQERGWPEIEVIGYREFGMTGKRNDLLYKDGSRCADIALILAYLILITEYNKAMSDDELQPLIEEKIAKDLKKEQLYYESRFFNDIIQQSGLYRYTADNKMFLRDYLASIKRPEIVLPLSDYQKPSVQMVRAFQAMFYETEFEIVEGRHNGFPKKENADDANLGKVPKNGILLSAEMEYRMALIDPFVMFKMGIGTASYNRFLSRLKSTGQDSKNPLFIPMSWSVPSMDSSYPFWSDLFLQALKVVFETKARKVEAADYYADLEKGRTYARSYQTKQNIPKKTLEAMEQSGFNDNFGYVEFDEDVDLAKVGVLQEEFESFYERYLDGFDLSKVSLRFRRLGNHKAAGLYYPNIACLCVDINNPGSFIHELGHCIDHTAAGDRDLSDMPGFMKVYSLYSELVKKEVSKSGILLKGKYDLKYYLINTEALARCWEMYVVRVLKIDLSICKPEEKLKDFAYPDSKELMEEIKSYFDALLESINVTMETAVNTAA